jgi:hypothetical protein
VLVRALDWAHESEERASATASGGGGGGGGRELPPGRRFQLVLCSDCLYEAAAVPLLADAFKRRVAAGGHVLHTRAL